MCNRCAWFKTIHNILIGLLFDLSELSRKNVFRILLLFLLCNITIFGKHPQSHESLETPEKSEFISISVYVYENVLHVPFDSQAWNIIFMFGNFKGYHIPYLSVFPTDSSKLESTKTKNFSYKSFQVTCIQKIKQVKEATFL